MSISLSVKAKNRIADFVWQHCLLLVSLYVMTLGVVLCVRSNMGSSVISSAPLAFSMAGADGLVPPLSIGNYTNILNTIFVVGQIFILRKKFELIQLLQLVIGFVFGALIDLNMSLTSSIECIGLLSQSLTQLAGCTVMGFGIAMEVRCGSITMPGEGLPVAIGRCLGMPFAKVKIYVDTSLVLLAVISCYVFWGAWQWNVVGVGTLFAMFYVGFLVKSISCRMGWFDKVLHYRPGMRRYIYGLARFIYSKFN